MDIQYESGFPIRLMFSEQGTLVHTKTSRGEIYHALKGSDKSVDTVHTFFFKDNVLI